MNLRFQRHLLFGEIVRQFAQQDGIDGYPRPLHIGQHHHQRPFQRLIDGALAFARQPGLQQHVKAQGDIGILGGIARRLFYRHTVESDLVLALAGDIAEGDRRMRQMQVRQFVHAVAVQPAFQHIRYQHGIVDGLQANATLQEHHRIVFQVLADLQDAVVFQQRLQAGDHIGLGHLFDSVAVLALGQVQ